MNTPSKVAIVTGDKSHSRHAVYVFQIHLHQPFQRVRASFLALYPNLNKNLTNSLPLFMTNLHEENSTGNVTRLVFRSL